MGKFSKKLVVVMMVLVLAWPAIEVWAQTDSPVININSPLAWVCSVLSEIGIPCGGPTTSTTTPTPVETTSSTTGTTTQTSPTAQPSLFASLFGGLFGSSNNTVAGHQTATIIEGFGGSVNHAKDAIILVQAPRDPAIYRIMGGKRFVIPNQTVFDSYGFNKSDIINMNKAQIMTYPRVKLVVVTGTSSKTVYYLTEGGMLRLIPNKKVFDSYADVDHDIVVIDSVEFSLYPKNEYIYNEATAVPGQKPQVYRISSNTKVLMSYDRLQSLGVTDAMIAPVNQTEFDAYKTLKNI